VRGITGPRSSRQRVIETQAYVVLRRSYLRSTVPVLKGRSIGTARAVMTPVLRILLTPSDAPQVPLTTSGRQVSVTIYRYDLSAL